VAFTAGVRAFTQAPEMDDRTPTEHRMDHRPFPPGHETPQVNETPPGSVVAARFAVHRHPGEQNARRKQKKQSQKLKDSICCHNDSLLI
jgi:hypothetical protein